MSINNRLGWIVTLAIFILSLSNATTYYVNASTGNNTNNGTSSGTAFKTITKALSVAVNADVINVAAGTYQTGETFPIEMVSGVTLTGTAGALTTIIQPNILSRVFNCISNSATTIIQGFTIKGGYVIDSSSFNNFSKGGGIYIAGSPIIQNNIITGNTVRGYDFHQTIGGTQGGNANGGGIYLASGAAPIIRNNVISENTALGGGGKDYRGGWSGNGTPGGNAFGGGINSSGAGAAIIMNNTFYGNKAIGGFGGSSNSQNAGNGGDAVGGALDAGGNVIVKNNIFSNNSAIGGSTGGGLNGNDGSSDNGAIRSFVSGNLSNNLYYNNSAKTNPDGTNLGTNNVMGSDPLFVSATNYHLSSTSSPAYHAGTPTGAPATDFEGTPRSGTTPSIGAFEGTDPLAVLTLTPSTYRKDTVAVGDSSVQKFHLKNASSGDLSYQNVSTKTAQFTIVGSASGTVKSNDSAFFSIVFKPAAFTEYLDTMTVTSASGTKKYPLSGFSPFPVLSSSVLSMDFGIVFKDSTSKKTIIMKNTSISKLRIDSVKTRTKQFTINALGSPVFLTKKDSSVLTLSFKPDSIRTFIDTLFVYSNQQNGIISIALTGKGNSVTSVLLSSDIIPKQFELLQNYPNPFNPSTVINFHLPAGQAGLPTNSHVTLKVYDALGREVATLVNEMKESGSYSTTFDASKLSSGIYFAKLQSGDKVQLKKMMLIK